MDIVAPAANRKLRREAQSGRNRVARCAAAYNGWAPVGAGERLQRDGATGDEAVARDDRVDDRLRDRCVAGDRHHRADAVVPVELTADGGGDDVDAMLAEDGA